MCFHLYVRRLREGEKENHLKIQLKFDAVPIYMYSPKEHNVILTAIVLFQKCRACASRWQAMTTCPVVATALS